MIHLSLPLRPRLDVRCEYLVTPISISLADGSRVLCITDANIEKDNDVTRSYIGAVEEKLGSFTRVFFDTDHDFHNSILDIVIPGLKPTATRLEVQTCECGKYEEVGKERLFGVRRVENDHCTFCNTPISSKVANVLLTNIRWPCSTEFRTNLGWAKNDLTRFLERQKTTHKISKRSEQTRVMVGGQEYGLRHQVTWAALIIYIAKVLGDNEVTIHYVHKTQTPTFVVASMAMMMESELEIHLRALPTVWLDNPPPLRDASPSQVKLLGKAIGKTKKKEIRVSLKSWIY